MLIGCMWLVINMVIGCSCLVVIDVCLVVVDVCSNPWISLEQFHGDG